jgi:hypothetical protein
MREGKGARRWNDDFRGLAEGIRSRTRSKKPQLWTSGIGGVPLAETFGMPGWKYRAAFKHTMSDDVVVGIVRAAACRATAIEGEIRRDHMSVISCSKVKDFG